MLTLIVLLFLVSYIFIALEHPLRINKASVALVAGVVLWVCYIVVAPQIVADSAGYAAFLVDNPSMGVYDYVTQVQLLEQMGDISEILFFLIGAMTIVELIDVHGGFNIITNRITTRDKRRLLWIIGVITFFMSATLDNLTTAIVMVTLLSKIITNYKERWVFAAVIIIAANSGGAWSPIGDVTTIMLWVRGNITTASIVPHLILPCLVSFLVPVYIAGRWLKGDVTSASIAKQASAATDSGKATICCVSRKERLSILLLGVGCLVSVPVFKTVTHLPPFMGILLALGIMWLYTEIMYRRKSCEPNLIKPRIPYVLRRIDTATILFFLGILLSVGALQVSGILGSVSAWLDTTVHNVYVTNVVIGLLSSVVDNVPLVAGAIASYPVLDPASVAAAADPTYAAFFVQSGVFWEFLAYCAGVGGSILIIGSAAGVVVMGLEKMTFGWYLKNISFLALIGFLCGALIYILQSFML